MNIKPIIVLIVLTAILSVSLVAAYENVEHNSNADGGISDVSSSHDVRHGISLCAGQTEWMAFQTDAAGELCD